MACDQPIRILIMEDDAGQAQLARRALERAGYTVEVMDNGTTGLAFAATGAYDVLLIDYHMPGTGGLEILQTLASRGTFPPTIMVTGHGDEAVAVEAMKLGASDYLVKDVEGQYLTLLPTVVARVLSQHRLLVEKRQAEEALQQHLEWLDTTLASLDDAVIATDPAGTITFLNPAAAHLTGWSALEACGQPVEAVFRLCHAPTRQAIEHPIHRVLATGERVSGAPETRLVTCRGREIPVADRAAPIRGRSGTLQGAVVVLRDMSEQQRLEAALRQAQKIQAIGTLAGGIAHEFNNILAVMLGFTELTTFDVPQDSITWRNLQHVLTAGQRAKEVVQQLLAFSRQTLLQRQPLRLQALVQEAFPLLRASLPSTIEIRTRLAPAAGAVLADATQMHQVLLNLCINAEYAMRPTGGILEVVVEAVDVEASLALTQPALRPGPYVRLTVRDTGQGMAPDVLERICEPYFTTKPLGEGSGLGLAVVHGIITQHGGAMIVTSTPGQGTTCTIYLPRYAEDVAVPPPRCEEELPGGTERILFVDDEPAMAALGLEVLTRLGYQVAVCSSSAEALALFRTAMPPFDLVITDYTMPRLTGDALIRALRQFRPALPVILCTGFSSRMDADRARAAGINAFVMKPWQERELAQTIRRVLDQQVSMPRTPSESGRTEA